MHLQSFMLIEGHLRSFEGESISPGMAKEFLLIYLKDLRRGEETKVSKGGNPTSI